MLKRIILILYICSASIFAQQDIGVSNQLEYSYDVSKKIRVFENWFNADYRRDFFSAGLRLDIFQPNDPDPSISRGKERFAGIDYKYLKVEFGDYNESLEITAGNYYALLGRGMILRSYEERNIRIDNNLLGLRIKGTYNDFVLTALSGSTENNLAERKDILHAVDVEYRGLDIINPGLTYALNIPDEETNAVTSMASARLETSLWNFDLYSEYGVKLNETIQNAQLGGDNIAGRGFYGNLSFYYDVFSITGEYKYYDNFGFGNSDETTSYNQPPALRKEYTYLLLNRHPFPLNQANEKGYHFDLNYNLSEKTYFNAAYGRTSSQAPGTYFQRILGTSSSQRILQEEAFIMGNHYWSRNFSSIAAFGYNTEAQSHTRSYTPIIENKFYFGDVNTIRIIFEHQQTTVNTTNEKYYDDALTVEYLRSPLFSMAAVIEMKTSEPVREHMVRKFWSMLQFGYRFGNHTDITLLIGSRQAGVICIGGVCRYEPEFSGIELKLFTRI
jgi:hypothetical protein